jgi:hypothetical protein
MCASVVLNYGNQTVMHGMENVKKTALYKQLCEISSLYFGLQTERHFIYWTGSISVDLTTLNPPPNTKKQISGKPRFTKYGVCQLQFTVDSLINADAVTRNGTRAHPSSIWRVVGAIFPAVKRPRCANDQQHPPSAKVKASELYLRLPIRLHGVVISKHCDKTPLQYTYRGAEKSLARPGRKQATATKDSDFHISYL